MATDVFIPNYAVSVPVVAGTPFIGPQLSLSGVAGVYAQIAATGGAAGTMYLNPTIGDPLLTPQFVFGNGQPMGDGVISVAVSANGHAGQGLVSTAIGLYARAFSVSFTPSVSGSISIAVNIRFTGT